VTEPRKPIGRAERPLPLPENLSTAPSQLPLGPWTVRVSKFTQAERKELLALVRDRTEQPLAAFQKRLAQLTDQDARDAYIREELPIASAAERLWPPIWTTAEFNRAAFGPENLADALEIVLRRNNPDSVSAIRDFVKAMIESEDEADADKLTDQALDVIERWMYGAKMLTRKEATADPKDEGETPPPTESPTNNGKTTANPEMPPTSSSPITTDSAPTSSTP
jgi:hypothetical protein